MWTLDFQLGNFSAKMRRPLKVSLYTKVVTTIRMFLKKVNFN